MSLLEDAINERRVVTFSYDGLFREVIPAAYGRHKDTGNLTLRGYQTGGESASGRVIGWKLFTEDEIETPVITAETFTENPPGYSKGDKHLDLIAEI